MIVEEILENNLIKTFSSDNKQIRQIEGNFICNYAIDIYPNPYHYEEYDEDSILIDQNIIEQDGESV